MYIPITQSEAWQTLQNDLNEPNFFEKSTDFQYLAVKKHTPVGNYLFLPYGPVSSGKAGFQHALASLGTLAKNEHALFIRIEPQSPDNPQILRDTANSLNLKVQKTKDLDPADTWTLDLAPDKATLISNFAQGTRTRYNTYAKKGIVVEKTRELSEIRHLVALQNKLFKQKHLTAYDQTYLETELKQPFATLYLAKYVAANDQTGNDANSNPAKKPKDGQILAASLFFDDSNTKTTYYMQSAAGPEFKKLPATVALLTTAIFDAKDKGQQTFDFWGIAPDNAEKDHPWLGFTDFKKSFGGTPQHYLGTYDLILKPIRYQLYQLLRKLRP